MFNFLNFKRKKKLKVGYLVEGVRNEIVIKGRIAVYPYERNGGLTVKLDNGYCFRPENVTILEK